MVRKSLRHSRYSATRKPFASMVLGRFNGVGKAMHRTACAFFGETIAPDNLKCRESFVVFHPLRAAQSIAAHRFRAVATVKNEHTIGAHRVNELPVCNGRWREELNPILHGVSPYSAL